MKTRYLSIDTLTIVASFITLNDLCSFQCVCSDWNYVINLFDNTDDDSNISDDRKSTLDQSTTSQDHIYDVIHSNNLINDNTNNNNYLKGLFWLNKYKSFLFSHAEKVTSLFNVEHLTFKSNVEKYFYNHEKRKFAKRVSKIENKIKKNSKIILKFDCQSLKDSIANTNLESTRNFIHNMLNSSNRVTEYIDSIKKYKYVQINNNLIYSDIFIKECIEHAPFYKNLMSYLTSNEDISQNVYEFIAMNYLKDSSSNQLLLKCLMKSNSKCSVKLCKILSLVEDNSFVIKEIEHLDTFLEASIYLGFDYCKELKQLLIDKCDIDPQYSFNEETFKKILYSISLTSERKRKSFLEIAKSSVLFNVNILDILDYCISIFRLNLQSEAVDYLFKYKFNSDLTKMDEYFHKVISTFKTAKYTLDNVFEGEGAEYYYMSTLNRNMFAVIDNNNYIINKYKVSREPWYFYKLNTKLFGQFKKNRNLNYFKNHSGKYYLDLEELKESVKLEPNEKIIVEENIGKCKKHLLGFSI